MRAEIRKQINKDEGDKVKMYSLWIGSAKKVETKADRIAQSIERLNKGLKLYEKKTP